MIGTLVVFGVAASLAGAQGDFAERVKRQDSADQGGQVIDNIFNIPITAIRQTAAAAQSFNPENTQAIDSVFKIPISTLEAVGNLVKSTTAQRRQNAEQIQQIRQGRRERILEQKERQRQQREEIQNERLRQQELKRIARHYHKKKTYGLNGLSSLLGSHGLLGHGHHGIHGGLGGLGGHFGGHGGHGGHFGGHGGHGSHGGHGNHGAQGILGSLVKPQNSYAVHEHIENDGVYSWHGITAGIGNYQGSRPFVRAQNKVAPKDVRPERFRYPDGDEEIENKLAPSEARSGFQVDPLANAVPRRSDRISFH